MRTITVRPHPDQLKKPKFVDEFLKSVGMDPDDWDQPHIYDATADSFFKIVGIQIPTDEIHENEWVWSTKVKKGSARLIINGRIVAAIIIDGDDIQATCDALPEELRHLSVQNAKGDPDLSPTSRFKDLMSLNASCTDVSDFSFVSNFSHLEWLDFSSCEALANLDPVRSLAKLKALNLMGCSCPLGSLVSLESLKDLNLNGYAGLNDLSAIAGMSSIESLNLGSAEKLNDLKGIESLNCLKALTVSYNKKISDLTPLFNLQKLTDLKVSCRSINDLSPLKNIVSLKNLKISGCEALEELSPISNLPLLESLDLNGNQSLKDISPLVKLKCLRNLNLGNCSKLTELSPICRLHKLEVLNLSSNSRITDLLSLSEASNIRELDLSWCTFLKSLEGLGSMQSLIRLDLEGCELLESVEPISNLPKLKSLILSSCDLIKEIPFSINLPSLDLLNLKDCKAITDISGLGGLNSLRSLILSGCYAIEDISSISKLSCLERLTLSRCGRIEDISPVASLAQLERIFLDGLKRLTDLEPLRGLPRLEVVVADFHPIVLQELVADNAAAGKNIRFIKKWAGVWLMEMEKALERCPVPVETIATTFAKAISILSDQEMVTWDFQELLEGRSEFSSMPWKAWFGGTIEKLGFDIYRKRVESIPHSRMTPGAIGGTCSTIPLSDHRDWSIEWLAKLELERADNAKDFLPVAPDICIAYSKAEKKEALGRWLLRFTDPSDPGALDPLHSQFAQWQLGQGNTQEALNHIAAINSPSVSDPLYAALSIHWLEDQPIKSGEVLLMIESPRIRRETGVKLAMDEGFTTSPENIHRLIAAVGDSASSLAATIEALGDRADSALIKELSESLQLAENDFKARHIARLEVLLKEAKSS